MKKKKLKLPVFGDIVELKWYDASSLDDWTNLKEIDPNLEATFTYGAVTSVNVTGNPLRDTLTIAGSVVPSTGNVSQYISIPVATIEYARVIGTCPELKEPEGT